MSFVVIYCGLFETRTAGMDMISIMKVFGRESFLAFELDGLDAKQRAVRTCDVQGFGRAVIENGPWSGRLAGRLSICSVPSVFRLGCGSGSGGCGRVDAEEVKERDGESLPGVLYCPC